MQSTASWKRLKRLRRRTIVATMTIPGSFCSLLAWTVDHSEPQFYINNFKPTVNTLVTYALCSFNPSTWTIFSNYYTNTSSFPYCSKWSVVVPINNMRNVQKFNDLRFISILSILFKLFGILTFFKFWLAFSPYSGKVSVARLLYLKRQMVLL